MGLQHDNPNLPPQSPPRTQRMTADESRAVIALWQQERVEQTGLTDHPAVPDVAEGLDIPVEEVQRLLGESGRGGWKKSACWHRNRSCRKSVWQRRSVGWLKSGVSGLNFGGSRRKADDGKHCGRPMLIDSEAITLSAWLLALSCFCFGLGGRLW